MKQTLVFALVLLLASAGCLVSPLSEIEEDVNTSGSSLPLPVKGIAAKRFEWLDNYVLNTPETAEKDVESLVSYLTEPCTNDVEKCRVVFTWICSNITYATWGAGYSIPTSPDNVLKSRSSVCSGYSRLFDALCEADGVESVTIEGFAKGTGYRPGDPALEKGNHAWNAVRIDGEWKLLDCTWGSGYINPEGEFVKRLDDTFFFISPEQLILTHLPEDPQWQLLKQTVSREAFVKSVFPKSAYFIHGIRAVYPVSSVVTTAQNQITLKLKVPEGIDMLAVVKDESGSRTKIRSSKDSRQNIVFNIMVTDPGNYYVNLFSGKSGDTLELTLQYLIVRQEP